MGTYNNNNISDKLQNIVCFFTMWKILMIKFKSHSTTREGYYQ